MGCYGVCEGVGDYREMTKDTLKWSDTTCLIAYMMLYTTLLCYCLIDECVSRTFLHHVTLQVHMNP
jgi:hypothetical protein